MSDTAPVNTQPCFVCCKDTEYKCGACHLVGAEVYLCSRECQKLVWYAHKRVCGQKGANPFKLPFLNAEDAAEFASSVPPPISSQFGALHTVLQNYRNRFRSLNIFEGGIGHADPNRLNCYLISAYSHLSKTHLYDMRRGKPNEIPRNIDELWFRFLEPFSLVGHIMNTVDKELQQRLPSLPSVEYVDAHSEWLTPLSHRLLLSFAAHRRGAKPIPSVLAALPTSVSISAAVWKYIREELEPTNPEIAAAVKETFEIVFMGLQNL